MSEYDESDQLRILAARRPRSASDHGPGSRSAVFCRWPGVRRITWSCVREPSRWVLFRVP